MNKKVLLGSTILVIASLCLGGGIIRSAAYSKNVSSASNVTTPDIKADKQKPGVSIAQPVSAVSTVDVDKVPEIIKYSVKPGDTLGSIAANYNVSINTIALSSGISPDSVLKENQELRFPSVDGLLYKVKDGETLWDICNTYSVKMSDIIGDNGIASPDELKLGQEIIIAGAKSYKETRTASSSALSKTSTKTASSTVKSSSNVKLASRSSNPAKAVKSAKTAQSSTKRSSTTRPSTKRSSTAQSSNKGLWPVGGSITSGFGMRWGKPHNGIDIAAPSGTDVHAYAAGTVVFSGWDDGGYGYLVIIDHHNGIRTYYGHNSKLIVSAGQEVSAGQHIADVGSTGDSTGYHCHFEVRKNGVPQNPLCYLN